MRILDQKERTEDDFRGWWSISSYIDEVTMYINRKSKIVWPYIRSL